MKILKFAPYILLLFSICTGIIIAIIQRISFILFFKKTIIFFLIIFFSSKFFVHTIINIKNNNADETIDIEQDSLHATNKTNNESEENDFQSLKFEKNEIKDSSKVIGSKFSQS